MTQTPAIGRMIHVIVDPDQNNGADRMAAVITKVHHDGMVNVRPFHDVSTSSTVDGITSLPLYQSESDAVAARDKMVQEYKDANENKAPDLKHVHYGYWPAHVGPAPVTRDEFEHLQHHVADHTDRLRSLESTPDVEPEPARKAAGGRKAKTEESDESAD